MSRQDANAAFALTSFLYGGNAAYIEDLYARYEADPASVDAEWQAFFAGPEGRAGRRRKKRPRRLLAAAGLAAARRMAIWSRPSTATGRRPSRRSATRSRRKAQATGVGDFRRRRAAGHARFDPRADADPRLPHARPSPRQSRSARPRSRRGQRGGARSALLRLHRRRPRPADLPRQGARARIRAPCARSSPSCSRTYCQTLGVEFMHISNPAAEGLDPGAHRGPRQGDHLHPRGQARHPQQAGRGRRLREVPATSSSPAPSASASTAANR